MSALEANSNIFINVDVIDYSTDSSLNRSEYISHIVFFGKGFGSK